MGHNDTFVSKVPPQLVMVVIRKICLIESGLPSSPRTVGSRREKMKPCGYRGDPVSTPRKHLDTYAQGLLPRDKSRASRT